MQAIILKRNNEPIPFSVLQGALQFVKVLIKTHDIIFQRPQF